MTAITLSGVSKHFGNAAALDDVHIEFAGQRMTAVIGRSGCGKSTLLKICNGLVRPDTGRVVIDGAAIDYENLPELRRGIGYAVQGNGLFPHLTAAGNITLVATLAGWQAQEIAERLEVLRTLTRLEPDLLERYPHQLSGGQQQRVGLCRAMMLQPAILLLDEPFAAVDPITRSDIHNSLLELLRAEPTTTLLVTHDMREALLLADQIVLMEAGSIQLQRDKTALLAEFPDATPEALLEAISGGVNA
jgi:osmoprotectant transport system ATP-binding protein